MGNECLEAFRPLSIAQLSHSASIRTFMTCYKKKFRYRKVKCSFVKYGRTTWSAGNRHFSMNDAGNAHSSTHRVSLHRHEPSTAQTLCSPWPLSVYLSRPLASCWANPKCQGLGDHPLKQSSSRTTPLVPSKGQLAFEGGNVTDIYHSYTDGAFHISEVPLPMSHYISSGAETVPA